MPSLANSGMTQTRCVIVVEPVCRVWNDIDGSSLVNLSAGCQWRSAGCGMTPTGCGIAVCRRSTGCGLTPTGCQCTDRVNGTDGMCLRQPAFRRSLWGLSMSVFIEIWSAMTPKEGVAMVYVATQWFCVLVNNITPIVHILVTGSQTQPTTANDVIPR